MTRRGISEKLIRNATLGVDGITELLVDGLDWPIPDHLETLPLMEWTPEELGLDAEQLGRLMSIRQVPKIESRQPFGVFILEFEGGRLPIGALRKVLNQLVIKRRGRKSNAASQWDLGDLIFFCHSAEGSGSVHVAAWNKATGQPDLKTISWTNAATPTRMELLKKHTLPDLVWPDGEVEIAQWRDRWRGAFSTGYRQGVRTAAQLSQRMAEVASDIRTEISDLLRVESQDGPLHALLAEMRQRLDAQLSEDNFGDVIAQTLVYGLLTSRISHPHQFKAAEGKALVDFENPFLDAIYGVVRDQAQDSLDLDQLGLSDLAHTLAESDMDSILGDFGADDRRDDPVIYLYEEFLEKYDPVQRHKLGAYYTPVPLVDAIIELADDGLKRVGGLPDGIADTTTWGSWASAHGVDVPDGVDSDSPVIQMLDPATGTGTFLLGWLRHIATGGRRTPGEVVDQMAALELSMASYAVAHLKLGLELPDDVRDESRLPIYLSDTLAGPRPQHLTGLEDPISYETAIADNIKFTRNATVIVGNPPYDRIAREEGGGWVLHPQNDQPNLFAEILDPAVEHTIFSYAANLYNLYVYFWRWSMWKAFEQTPNSPAVVSLVTASSWLDGPGFLGLRSLARALADDISILDLGGDGHGGRKDENVFGIQTPVAIVTLARRCGSDRSTPATVRYRSVDGTRNEKLQELSTLDVGSDGWNELDGEWFDSLKPQSGGASWARHPLLSDLFPWQQPGCKFGRTWPIAPHPDLLRERWDRFMSTNDVADREHCFATSSSGRNIHTLVNGYARLVDEEVGSPSPQVVPYGYRSFDSQFVLDDPRLAALERPSLWASLGPEQIFMVVPSRHSLTSGPGASITTAVPDLDSFRGAEGGKDVYPLFRDGFGLFNVDPALVKLLKARLETSSVGPAELFAYCYGILAGTDYTIRFREALESPGARIPLSRDVSLFEEMVAHGRTLIALNTRGGRQAEYVQEISPHLPIWAQQPSRPPANLRECSHAADTGTLRVADGVLEGVGSEVWEFNISGMPVIRKWLGYRTSSGAGRAASSSNPLDQIRPTKWYPEWSEELSRLVATLQLNVEAMETGASILDRIMEGALIDAAELPKPPEKLRKAPAARRAPAGSEQQTLL